MLYLKCLWRYFIISFESCEDSVFCSVSLHVTYNNNYFLAQSACYIKGSILFAVLAYSVYGNICYVDGAQFFSAKVIVAVAVHALLRDATCY
jgi:hypothetical protein